MDFSSKTLLFIIIGLVIFSFLVDQILEILNLKNQKKDIPEEIRSFYDTEKYLRAQDYHRTKTRFSFFSSTFSLLISLLMLGLGGFGWLDAFLREYTQHPIGLPLLFFAFLGLGMDWLTLPFQWYGTFVIEEKFGFNKTTYKTFFLDKIKGYALGALLGGVLMGALLYLMEKLGPGFWIYFAGIASAFLLFMNVFYTSLLLPLFNKLTPLGEGELKTAIEIFAKKVQFPLDQIFVMDGSKRSSKANAFFSGMGKKKKIVLFDTLIANHTQEELVAVLAHEVGHYKKKHVVGSLFFSVVQIVFTLFILSLMAFNENLSLALGGQQQAIHLNLIAFTILFSPISSMTGLAMNWYSRKNEFEADQYAKANYDGQALGQALKKLSVDTLSTLYPHSWYVFFHYSHPPLLKRLAALKE